MPRISGRACQSTIPSYISSLENSDVTLKVLSKPLAMGLQLGLIPLCQVHLIFAARDQKDSCLSHKTDLSIFMEKVVHIINVPVSTYKMHPKRQSATPSMLNLRVQCSAVCNES